MQVNSCILGAVVWTDFLHQSVVSAVERHIDTDDLERFGAHPGDVALGLLLSTSLGRVVVTQHHLFVAFCFLIVHPAVERLGVFWVDHTLTLQIKLQLSNGRDQTDRHVAHTCGVVTEVDSQRAVPMIHDLAHYQQIQFDSLDV